MVIPIWFPSSKVVTMEGFHLVVTSPEMDVPVTLRGNSVRVNACLVEALKEAVLRPGPLHAVKKKRQENMKR